ncbi:MAG: hypothetical protein QME68_06580, partial [Elusimicrobiota bacterium]|nr:hypothetical protein [Elusimicrobiota bacterium]
WLLENNGFFDEEFPYPAFEDNELGYRLKKSGLILKYNKLAIGYHYHYTSIEDACQRMIKVGEASQILTKKINSITRKTPVILSKIRSFARYIRGKICYPIAKFYEKRAIKSNIFYYVLAYYRDIGIRRYLRETKKHK